MDPWSLLALIVIVALVVGLAAALARTVLADGRGWRPPPAGTLADEAVRTWPR